MSQFIEMFGNPNRNTKGFNQYAISDIFDLQMGKTPERDNQNYWNKGVNIWISISDMQDDCKYVGDSKEYITDMAVSESGIKIIPQGTLLMSFKLTIGRVAIADKDIYTNEAIMAFKDKCVVELSQQWLYNLLTQYDWLGNASQAAKGKTLNKEIIGRSIVSIPPIEMQEEFATIVQQADKSKFIGFKSQFIEMSGDWERHKLDSFIDIVRGVSYKPTDVVDSNNPCATGILRANNISDGELNTVEMVYVNNERVSEIQKLRPKDIVMCASSGSQYLVGKAAINKHLHSNYAHGAFCLLIRCKELLMPEFLNLYLQTDDYRGQIEEKSCGSNILNIKQSDITSLIIPIPNFAVQQNFVTILKQADKSKYIN